jgi:hypothetical protein
MKWASCVSVLIAAAALATACDGSSGVGGAPQASSASTSTTASTEESSRSETGPTTTAGVGRRRGAHVLFLLADRRLLAASVRTGVVVASVTLGPASPTPDVGRFLALSRDRGTLFALVPWTPETHQVVVELDPATLRIRARLRLPPGLAFRSLVVGPESGRLYVFGNRPARRKTPAPEDAVVIVLDPASGAVLLHGTFAKGTVTSGGSSMRLCPKTKVASTSATTVAAHQIRTCARREQIGSTSLATRRGAVGARHIRTAVVWGGCTEASRSTRAA